MDSKQELFSFEEYFYKIVCVCVEKSDFTY